MYIYVHAPTAVSIPCTGTGMMHVMYSKQGEGSVTLLFAPRTVLHLIPQGAWASLYSYHSHITQSFHVSPSECSQPTCIYTPEEIIEECRDKSSKYQRNKWSTVHVYIQQDSKRCTNVGLSLYIRFALLSLFSQLSCLGSSVSETMCLARSVTGSNYKVHVHAYTCI